VAQRAVVIDLGETEILERQMAHAVERGVHVDGAGADVLEKRAQVVTVHTIERIAGDGRE